MKWTKWGLFRSRLTGSWIKSFKAWKLALDWTVWVYFLVPGIWIAGGTYLEWWREEPSWLMWLPEWVVLLPLLFYALSGGLRVFLYEADMLFLLQRKEWLRSLIRYGALYTLLKHTVGTALLCGLLLLLLVKSMGLNSYTIFVLGLFTLVMKFGIGVIQNMLYGRWKGLQKLGMELLLSLLTSAVYMTAALLLLQEPVWLLAAAAAAAAAGAGLFRRKLRMQGTFAADVEQERKASAAVTEILLTPVMEKKPLVKLDRPLVFRRSGRIFRKSDAGTMLAEMRIKAFLRKFAHVRLWVSFFSVSTVATLASPGWLGLLLAVTLPLLAASWLHQQWKEWAKEPFLIQFKWEDEALRKGASLSGWLLLLPGVIWLFMLTGWLLGGLMMTVLMVPAGILYWWVSNKLLNTIMDPVTNKE
ncbi:ABC transporter permease [Paenibacillus tarimensis]|uniref:ABC transporter permease n=1 Tax=Paenibacillus tarimensis TaxID=416012 RepID=UPI001F28085E|nr:ABC transporter permease [Paenibacillus tarimensis]MCF2945961.1 ABC transporter permease [Paenibacillus tarimensis]